MELQKFFNPRSVAVIGASSDPKKVGFALVENLKNSEKEREIHAVTRENSDIPEGVDLAVIAVKADLVPEILEECGKKNIKNAIIISSGFRETGPSGEDLEAEIAGIAEKFGMAVLGPNCLGVIDTQNDFNASFGGNKPLAGKIAFVSQSGALGTALADWARGQGIGISKFISLGNESCLTEVEFLEYLENDPGTSSILLYLENVKNGEKFMQTLSRVAAKKTVVVIKAGIGSHGNLAIRSHTGALAPEASVFIAACKQAGAVTVSSLRGFFHTVKVLGRVDNLESPVQRLIVLTNGGGPSIVTADLIDHSYSLSLVVLPEKTKEKLRQVLPPMAAVENPIDIIGDALAERYDKALEILTEDDNTDGIITILTPQMMTEVEETAKILAKYKDKKKIFPVFVGGPSIRKGREILIENGLSCFTFPRDVVESLDYLAKGAPKIKSPLGHHGSIGDRGEVGLKLMPFRQTVELLEEYGIRVNGRFIATKEELAQVMENLREGPYAMKAFSNSIVHKTEHRAVRLGISNKEEAEKIWDEWAQNINPLEGVLIQNMEVGREVLIGMKRDISFGPAVVFGLGGIYSEVLRDTSLRIAPISKKEALEMMREIKSVKILEGIRSESAANFDLLAEIIVNISKLSVAHPEVKEIDLNPVMITGGEAAVVDARIMI